MAMRSIALRSAPSRPRVSPRAPSRPAPVPLPAFAARVRSPLAGRLALPRDRWPGPTRAYASQPLPSGCSASTASVPAGQIRLQRLHQPEPAAARRRSHCWASRAALPWLRSARRLAVPSGSAPDPPRVPRACVASPASLAPAPARPVSSASTRLRRGARAVSPCRPYAARPAADSGSPVPPAGLCLVGSSPSADCRCAGRFPVAARVAS
ncbi:atherin, partial [Triticum aestivum]|uniref:atherin n=1 Tax=Triticum aestivum TaxID=4565 RepID=UPI001D027BFD